MGCPRPLFLYHVGRGGHKVEGDSRDNEIMEKLVLIGFVQLS